MQSPGYVPELEQVFMWCIFLRRPPPETDLMLVIGGNGLEKKTAYF